jgi:hypothetical protein
VAAGAEATASTSGRGEDGLEEAVQKLDSLMEACLQHLDDRCASGQGGAAWNSLLDSFQRTILPTFRAKFTQFLVWFLCSKVRVRAALHVWCVLRPCMHVPLCVCMCGSWGEDLCVPARIGCPLCMYENTERACVHVWELGDRYVLARRALVDVAYAFQCHC